MPKRTKNHTPNFYPSSSGAIFLFTGGDRGNLESILVDFNDIIERHRLDIRMNTQFKVSLTTKDDKPVYIQSLPVPINLKTDLTVELAPVRILTMLFISTRNANLTKIEATGGSTEVIALILDDNVNNNHSISTLSDAAQPLARKKTVF